MKVETGQWISIIRILLVAVLAIAGALGYDIAIIQPREIVVQEETLEIARLLDTDNLMPLAGGVSHFTELEADTVKAAAPTAIATSTPALMADSLGVSNVFELRTSATPVWYTTASGNTTGTGTLSVEDLASTDDATVADDLTVTDDLLVTGLINWTYGEENIGLPSVISTAITWTAAAGGTGAVTTIADGEVWFVHAVFVNVTTNFDCTGDDTTLVVGDGTDGDGFVVLADAELQAADTEQTGSPAGWQGLVAATMGVFLDGAVSSAPHIYAPSGAAETIDWLIDEGSGETITAGAATIYVIYTRIS